VPARRRWALLQYPENVALGNMLYYLAAPTLTYQVNFPRSHRWAGGWGLGALG
jgi:diacylglycerol O-acyltransferase-1